MIVVTGRVHVAAENRERFIAIATEMCSRSREEDACRGYRVYADLEQDDRYILVEEWADDDALQRHFAQPHTATFMGGRYRCWQSPPTPCSTRSSPRASWTPSADSWPSTDGDRPLG